MQKQILTIDNIVLRGETHKKRKRQYELSSCFSCTVGNYEICKFIVFLWLSCNNSQHPTQNFGCLWDFGKNRFYCTRNCKTYIVKTAILYFCGNLQTRQRQFFTCLKCLLKFYKV